MRFCKSSRPPHIARRRFDNQARRSVSAVQSGLAAKSVSRKTAQHPYCHKWETLRESDNSPVNREYLEQFGEFQLLFGMWRSLINFFYSLWTYSDLSPDLHLRRRVNKTLRSRTSLSATGWFQTYWQPLSVARSISDFVYTQMQTHSGLEFGRVQPGDRLHEDLHLSLVCWFNWETTFCVTFAETFGTDLEPDFNPDNFYTVADLVLFLNRQILSTNRF